MTVGITELPPEGMQLGGVALAGDAERGTKTTEGLSLLFTTAGITVQGPQPQIERLLVWSGLDTASCREKIALPDGRNAAVMELTSGGQAIRFLLPMDAVTPGQAAYLDQALPAWLARYKGSVVPSAPPPPAPSAAPPPPPTQSSAQSNGGSASSGRQPSGKGGETDITTPPAPGAPAGAPSNGPANAEVAAAAAAAAAAAGAAAASANGTTRGPADPDPGSTPTAFGPPPTASSTDPGSTAARPDPAGSSFIARSNIGSLPPSGDAPASGTRPSDLPPPPPGAQAPGGANAGAAPGTGTGWDPVTGAAAFEAGAVGGELAPDVKDPAKKPRGWRKNRAEGDAPVGTAPQPPTEFFSPPQPPTEPPSDPVPLKLAGTLPPPPAESLDAPGTRPPITWKPPIDPLTGKPAWDQSDLTVEAPPKKRKSWRKGAKAGAAAGAAGAAGVAGGTALAGSADPDVAPPLAAPSGAGSGQPATATEPAPKSNRALLAVLLVALLVVIGGIAYFAVRNNSNSTTTTVAGSVVPPRAAADTALAASINLRLTDLPTGWTRSPSTVQPPVPVAPASAQAQAVSGLSSCLSQPNGLVAGLFGSATVPGAAAAVSSPIFQSAADTGIQMSSRTTVMATSAGNQVLAAPFANPSFASCYAAYQTALVSAVAPGATATVQSVALPVPAGVRSFGYLTTFTAPGGHSAVEGAAFIFGTRTETRLTPMTNGPAVPQATFASAYDSITTRVAQAANK